MQLAPNVHWIEGVQANVYLLVEETHCALIDTGQESIDRVDVILNYLERLHFYPAGLKRILLTHAHPEQAGNVAALREVCEATIYASTAAGRCLRAGRSISQADEPEAERSRVSAGRFPAVAEEENAANELIVSIEDGDVLPILGGLMVLNAAGHTPDQLAFYLPQSGVLFAGDALWPEPKTGWVTAANPMLAQRTAQRLLTLSPAVVATAQGKPQQTHTLNDILALQHLNPAGEEHTYEHSFRV